MSKKEAPEIFGIGILGIVRDGFFRMVRKS